MSHWKVKENNGCKIKQCLIAARSGAPDPDKLMTLTTADERRQLSTPSFIVKGRSIQLKEGEVSGGQVVYVLWCASL